MIRYDDLSDIYEENGKWHTDEQLYPECRGYVQHSFDTEDEARAFMQKIKAADNQPTLEND